MSKYLDECYSSDFSERPGHRLVQDAEALHKALVRIHRMVGQRRHRQSWDPEALMNRVEETALHALRETKE
jgi:hypothetical protein